MLRLRYFLFGENGRLSRVSSDIVHQIWTGQVEVPAGLEKIICVAHAPVGSATIFLVRLEKNIRRVSAEARQRYQNAVRRLTQDDATKPDNIGPWADSEVKSILDGWPSAISIRQELQKLLGRPSHKFEFALGGPFADNPSRKSFRFLRQGLLIYSFELVSFSMVDYPDIIFSLEKLRMGIRDLVTACNNVSSSDMNARLDATAILISFFVRLTFGLDQEWQSHRKKLGINPWRYRIFEGTKPTVVSIGGTVFPLGRVLGFSSAIPLTQSGVCCYRANKRRASELNNDPDRDLADEQSTPTGVSGLLMGGTVFLPSVPGLLRDLRSGTLVRDETGRYRLFPNEGRELFAKTVFPQVVSLLPRFRLIWIKGEPNVEYEENAARSNLPVIFCPISGLGMGDSILEKCGFWVDPVDSKDRGGNLKYVFDFASINDVNTPIERRKKMARALVIARRLSK